MPTPIEVLNWDVSGLQAVADNATRIAEAIITASNTMHGTIYGLAWKGDARSAAEGRADREQIQMRAIAIAYDDLSTACAGAARDMANPLSEIRSIFQHYVALPVTVGDDWSISGVEDWNSEAGVQLSRLGGLASTLETFDAQWGAKIAAANDELAAMAPESVLAAANAAIQANRSEDSRADPERIRTSAAAFQQVFGRPPTSPNDWTTAEALNPKSFDPKYQGVGPDIRVVRINPVQDQGVVRTSQYIEQRDVTSFPPTNRDMGDNRAADPNFDPEHTRVATYVDYENGIVVIRQNPSVDQNPDGSPGVSKVGAPEATVWQADDGTVRVRYDAANPFAPDIARNPPGPMSEHPISVNGDLVFISGQDGVQIQGARSDYPSLEAYQDRPDGSTRTITVDPAASGRSWGPSVNLPFHHELPGTDPNIFDQFKTYQEYPGDQPPGFPVTTDLPGTAAETPDKAPSVRTITEDDHPLGR